MKESPLPLLIWAGKVLWLKMKLVLETKILPAKKNPLTKNNT